MSTDILPPPTDSPVRTGKNIGAILRTTLLNIAAAGGTVCIILVACAFIFNISLIMFKTGSMSPTIPAGSLAIVREIPASEVEIGDIVTVERPGKLPVTHRVISIDSAPGGTDTMRALTLQGDANPVPDPAPYLVEKVRTVMWSIPGLAKVITMVSNKWAMLGTTVAVSALVTWVLWPRPIAGQQSPRHRKSK